MRKTKAAAVLLFIYIFSLLFGNMSAFAKEDSAVSGEAVECDLKLSSRLWELLFGKSEEASGEGRLMLCPGGDVFGAKIVQKYVSITSVGDNKRIKEGDLLVKINGESVNSIGEVKKIVTESCGKPQKLTLLRSGEEICVEVTPKSEGGEWHLGLGLRDGAAGIGTVTFIDKETGIFGGLGHAICDKDTGEVIEMRSGVATEVVLGGVKKGTVGNPGELTGVLTGEVRGELYKNCECGIFGRLNPKELEGLTEVEVGKKEELHEGKAEIISTIKNGKTAHFDVEIHDIDLTATGNKCFKIKVTDEALIALNGGIVRGMSGSSILQDGKLVGAVTHVLVADPTEGYGIFIENMLSAAQSQVQPKAA